MNFTTTAFGYASELAPNYFEKQNDYPYAFQGAPANAYYEPNQVSPCFAFGQSDMFVSRFGENSFSDNLDSLSHFKELGSFEKDLESVEATIDNYESSHASSNEVGGPSQQLGEGTDSSNFSNDVSAPLDLDALSSSTLKQDSVCEAEVSPLHTSVKQAGPATSSDGTAKPSKTRIRKKLFSRRKDVIIKTLLRKCRKFLTQDFNTATNYAKQKRRLGNSILADQLKTYLTSVVKVQASDSLVAFLGALLYQQNMESNLDNFTGTDLTPAQVKQTSAKVHEILYKYSHQKFKLFVEYTEFVPIFMHFYKNGTDELKNDSEYEAGLQIIKDQLHSQF